MENVFNVKYNSSLDRLQIVNEKKEGKLIIFIKRHKFVTLVMSCFLALSGLNFYLIFSFMKILENFYI